MHYAELPKLLHPEARLRSLQASDLPVWAAYLMQPAVYEHTSWNLRSADELEVYLAPSKEPDRMLRLALVDPASDRLIGTVGFHTVSSLHRSAELSYDLAPSHWGRGIARAAASSLTGWAHREVGMDRVQATVLVSNQASARVLQACGFEREGLLRHYRQVRGRAGNFWMFSHLSSSSAMAA